MPNSKKKEETMAVAIRTASPPKANKMMIGRTIINNQLDLIMASALKYKTTKSKPIILQAMPCPLAFFLASS